MSKADDAGFGSLLTLTVVLAVLTLLGALLLAAHLLQVKGRLDTAADLAALAAASEAMRSAPASTACETAAAVADRNNAELEACEVDGSTVVVVVGSAPPPALTRIAVTIGRAPPRLRSRARAGSSGGT